jgi:uncharacterized protein (TIGR02145 family)
MKGISVRMMVVLIFSALLFHACEKKVVPVVITGEVTDITGSSATCAGEVIDEGSSPIYTRGICWSVNENPTVDDDFTNSGTGLGSYTSNLVRLDGSTVYYVRAYATNDDGTGYGDEVSFQTAPREIIFNQAITYGSLTDQDGNTYRSVDIGEQTWMAENLRAVHYRDGSEIPKVTDLYTWTDLTTGGFCYYDNDSLNKYIYGALYNWYVIEDERKICPEGWHVPSDEEWTELENYMGGSLYAGMKLKEIGQSHWASPNVGATNESGFTGLPGGARYWSFQHDFWSLEYFGIWWSSTESYTDSQSAWYRYISTNSVDVASDIWWKITGFSIRCVKD